MREKETVTCNFNFDSILEPPHNSLSIWRDAQRHGHAVMFLARQLAFKETGEQTTANEIAAHLKKHEARLIVEAEKVIATRWEFEDWRFPRRD